MASLRTYGPIGSAVFVEVGELPGGVLVEVGVFVKTGVLVTVDVPVAMEGVFVINGVMVTVGVLVATDGKVDVGVLVFGSVPVGV